MSGRPIATLRAPGGRSGSWRWELSAGDDGQTPLNVPLPRLDLRELLGKIAEVDRVHAGSEYTYAVAARNAVVERLLTNTWSTVVKPLTRYLGGVPSLTVRVPDELVRLPIATARCSASGESLVHMSDVTLQPILGPTPSGVVVVPEEPAAYRPRLAGAHRPHRWYSNARIHRLDGHRQDIRELLQDVAVSSTDTVLLMGCRTVDLLPHIKRCGTTAVVATLWDVEDRACGSLGDDLVAAIPNGLSPAEALRSVQALWSSRPPFEWAAYVVVEPLSPQPLHSTVPELVVR
ncbi:MAG: CHAT domain-containing protein [Acidimicrobiales bacterium]|nr:CHAT domain-containing protein [Acidimicrobiales bacterium]